MSIDRRGFLGAALALPASASATWSAPARDQLVFGGSTYPPNMSPWANTGASTGGIKLLMHRGLLSYDPSGALRGELAESWAQEGELAWVFRLREAVFQNGAPVTSEDVRWTLEQVAAEKSTAYLRAEMQGVERVETPDARTVRIVMRRPTVTLPVWMASMYLPIVAKGSTDGSGPGIGAGPYRLTAQEKGVSLEFERFDRFYRPGQPKLRSVKFVIYADENTRVAALHAGDVDIIEYVPWQAMQAIEADPKLRLDGVNGAFMYLTFNGRNGPFKDPRVRLAAALAVRREEIVKAAFYGYGSPLEGLPIPEGSDFYNPDLSRVWRADQARAKALLAEAGLADGFSCNLLSTAQFGMMRDTGVVVQQHLAEIGIKAQLNLPDWGGRVTLASRGQYDLSIAGTATDNNDPDALTSLVDGSLPASFQRSFGLSVPRISELLIEGRGAFDKTKRKAIYDDLQRTVGAEASFVGLAWRRQAYAVRREVQGFKNMPGALTFYSNLTLDEATLG